MNDEPTRRGRTTRRAGRDKGEVLRASAAVIGRRGSEATRFIDVAEASGVPVSTLQYYFGSREDLLVATFRYASETELAALTEDLSRIPHASRRLERIVEGVLGGYRPEAGQGPLWIEAWRFALRDEEMREDIRRDNLSWRGLVEAAVRDVLADGRPTDKDEAAGPDPARAAILILALLDGLGLPLALGDPAIDYDTARATALSGISSVLGLPPGTPA